MTTHPHGVVLVVAGSDPSAGAGLQADLKTVVSMGGYAMTAVTTITVQDAQSVYHVHPLPGEWVAQQMRVCLAASTVDCIKLGMLATAEIVLAVANVLTEWPHIPVVADPVLSGTGGGTLLDHGGRQAFLSHLLPLLALLTPNLPEAHALSGLEVCTVADMERAARHLAALTSRGQAGKTAILVKGGHLHGDTMTDLLFDGKTLSLFHGQRVLGSGFHGTGCVLASAIATALAQGKPLKEAVGIGVAYVRRAIQSSFLLGKGPRVLHLSA